jgi:hypothetical protein
MSCVCVCVCVCSPRAFRVYGYNSPDISNLLGNSTTHSKPFGMSCKSLCPEWDPLLDCFITEFDDDRVSHPSIYNMTLYEDRLLVKKNHKNECEWYCYVWVV